MLTTIFWIIVVLVVLAFHEQIIQAAVFIGFFMGLGALLFWWLFDNSDLGATVGFIFAVIIGLRMILQSLGTEYAWRIRPIYVFNFRTGRAQHIDSGLRHWLFCETVIDDIVENIWFTMLAGFSFLVALWFLFFFGWQYVWNYLWEEYLWWWFT